MTDSTQPDIPERYAMRYEQLLNTPMLNRVPYFHDEEMQHILEVGRLEQKLASVTAERDEMKRQRNVFSKGLEDEQADCNALHEQIEKLEAENERPKIICLCGSTRFIENFAVLTWELEREGNIVLGCTLLPQWYCDVPSHFGEKTGTKAQCDELHKRKIDLADEILVINIGGYIGESTRSEIEYATGLGKPVHYVEQTAESK